MFLYEAGNSYFNKRILLKNDKSFINSDYEVALVTAYRERQFEWWLKRTSLLVVGSRAVFQSYYIVAHSLKR